MSFVITMQNAKQVPDSTDFIEACLTRAGQLGERVARYDWAATELGRLEDWPAPLLHGALILLCSPVPGLLFCGSEGRMLYNDACAPILGRRHPIALGARVLDIWPEVKDFIEPVLATVLAGETLSLRDHELLIDLRGGPETVWLNLDYSPVPDEQGRPIAVLALVADTTAKVLAERRLAVEREALQREFENNRTALARQTQLMAIAESTAKVGGWEIDMDSGRSYWSPQTYRLYGYEPGEVEFTGALIRSHFLPDSLPALEQAALDMHAGRPIELEARIRSVCGQIRHLHILGSPQEAGTRHYIGSIQDISEFRQATAQLHLHARCLENATDGILISDPTQADNPVIFCNQGFERLTGYRREEVLGRDCGFLRGPETDPKAAAQLQAAVAARQPCSVTIKHYRKDGSAFWNRLSTTPLFDERGRLTHFIGILTDMTESVQLADELSWQASHDPLTALMNRREFERRLDSTLARAHGDGSQHVVCYLDLDNFKIINDSSGHVAGDRMLQGVADILRKQVRVSDSVARLGGDEFGILLEDCSVDQALVIAGRIIAAVGEFRFHWQDKLFRTGASVGLCLLDDSTPSTMEALKQADSACYTAKEAGGSRFHIYALHDRDIQRRMHDMESFSLVTRGLDEGHFFLTCQQIQPLAPSGAEGDHIEILLRLRTPCGASEMLPGSFLPSAERFGISPQLDRWVIDTTFRLLALHPRYLEQLHLCSINLSGISVNQENFGPYIRRKLREYGIPPSRICFEITETAAIANLHGASRFMNAVKELGCRFALDDFGSGLSSYAYLNSLPVDFVKIDGMFVKDMERNPVHQAMVRSIHEIASLMGKRTIAEYVDNAASMEILRGIGVDFIQGFAIGMPSPFEARLQARSR